MGVPTSEVGYPSVTTGRGDHEVHKRHVVALGEKYKKNFGMPLFGKSGHGTLLTRNEHTPAV
jgi:hypothetical protein